MFLTKYLDIFWEPRSTFVFLWAEFIPQINKRRIAPLNKIFGKGNIWFQIQTIKNMLGQLHIKIKEEFELSFIKNLQIIHIIQKEW